MMLDSSVPQAPHPCRSRRPATIIGWRGANRPPPPQDTIRPRRAAHVRAGHEMSATQPSSARPQAPADTSTVYNSDCSIKSAPRGGSAPHISTVRLPGTSSLPRRRELCYVHIATVRPTFSDRGHWKSPERPTIKRKRLAPSVCRAYLAKTLRPSRTPSRTAS